MLRRNKDAVTPPTFYNGGMNRRQTGLGLLAALLAGGLAGCQTAPPAPPAALPASPPTPPAALKPPKPPRIGLALGGGAARGFAHIGVIQVL